MMAVNNEVGTILPVDAAAGAIAAVQAPALLHVDAVQAYGRLSLNPARQGIDLMTVSAHKIHGPKGAGALYIACLLYTSLAARRGLVVDELSK